MTAALGTAVQVLDAVARQLADAQLALGRVRLEVQAARRDTAWQAAAARAYRQKAESWDAAAAAAIARLADGEWEVRRLRDTAWAQGAGG